jgi:hypothetical protein
MKFGLSGLQASARTLDARRWRYPDAMTMEQASLVSRAARSIASLAPAVCGLDQIETELADIARAEKRGYFTPDEDDRVRARFAQYLGARAALLRTTEELRPLAMGGQPVDDEQRVRAFVAAYAAATMLVHAGRFIVERFATSSMVQRKLNEAEPRFGIPRKKFTEVYKSLTDPLNAFRLKLSLRYAAEHRDEIEGLSRDPEFAPVLDHLRQAEQSLNMSKRRFALAHLRYRWHSLRRRRASAFAQAMFAIFESSGRIIADIHNPFHEKRITPAIRTQLAELLEPGDVMVSRHDDAASNLFLPGYWIHASLHIGDERARQNLRISLDEHRASRWVDPIRVLEAKKDGVLFRPLEETLAVDAVAVLRPRLAPAEIAQAIARSVAHEGKLYDFEFDFFRSDRLVCTEVVYRGYHGVGRMEFELSQRAGRPTLSAEDLIAMALAGRGFEPVAVFGTPTCVDSVLQGKAAADAIAKASSRSSASTFASSRPSEAAR